MIMVTVNLKDNELTGLLERIEVFELDLPGAQLPFTSRLAREQGWTHVFAGRVIREYKRFIGLAMAAGHPVSPSEAVDQAWHLHLVYTKSYWHDLCRDLLGKELHHSPTTGGMEESAKFDDWYARTLASYRRIYQDEPPSDIWPSAERRKKETHEGRWIDASRTLAIPIPAWLSPRRLARCLTQH